MNSTDNNGLGLFDDTASAAGNFPSALRGYDRAAVDEYVRALESNVVQSRQLAAQLEQQVSQLQARKPTAAKTESGDDAEPDYSKLGDRANDILRLAQEQARELVTNATVEAEQLKEQARREADGLRQSAAREGDAIKTGGTAQVDELRVKLAGDVEQQVAKSQSDADALLAAARRQAESLVREAQHEADGARQQAHLTVEGLRRAAEREIAEERQQIAAEREGALAELKRVHDDAQQRTAVLLAEATRHHTESTSRLEADITEAARIRSEAVAAADQLTQKAAAEAEARITTAKKQAQAISERTQQEFAWRKQQLKRETDLLHERKQAVLGQLASLSALAQQTANAFPDLDDPSEIEQDGSDHTILRPAGLPPAGPEDDSESSEDDIPVDGDATVLVSPAQLPAGTQHLGQKLK